MLRLPTKRTEVTAAVIQPIKFGWHLTHVNNLPSIFNSAAGIISKNALIAQSVDYFDISMAKVQAYREHKQVFGLPLHDFVPSYVCQRNPMMYLRRANAADLVWLKVDTSKLVAEHCYTADRNAATLSVKFFKGIQPQALNWAVLNAACWHDKPDGKAYRCAEILVHNRIPVSAIVAAEVSSFSLMRKLENEYGLLTHFNPDSFFAATSYQDFTDADICFK